MLLDAQVLDRRNRHFLVSAEHCWVLQEHTTQRSVKYSHSPIELKLEDCRLFYHWELDPNPCRLSLYLMSQGVCHNVTSTLFWKLLNSTIRKHKIRSFDLPHRGASGRSVPKELKCAIFVQRRTQSFKIFEFFSITRFWSNLPSNGLYRDSISCAQFA